MHVDVLVTKGPGKITAITHLRYAGICIFCYALFCFVLIISWCLTDHNNSFADLFQDEFTVIFKFKDYDYYLVQPPTPTPPHSAAQTTTFK